MHVDMCMLQLAVCHVPANIPCDPLRMSLLVYLYLHLLQAKLLRDIDSVVAVVIALKTHYPKVDIANIIKRKPKLLLSTQQRVEEDAQKVKPPSAVLSCCMLCRAVPCRAAQRCARSAA